MQTTHHRIDGIVDSLHDLSNFTFEQEREQALRFMYQVGRKEFAAKLLRRSKAILVGSNNQKIQELVGDIKAFLDEEPKK